MRLQNLEVANSNTQNVTVGSNVNLGSIVRRYTNSCTPVFSYDGVGTITLLSAGYYYISMDATFAGATTGNVTFNIESNNTNVPYAGFTQTVGTATTESHSGSSTIIVRVLPNAPININVSISDTGAIVNKVNVKVVKVI